MAQQILQVNFKFNVPREQYENTVSPMAQDFANVPGCLWKVWLMNEKESEPVGYTCLPMKHQLRSSKAVRLSLRYSAILL